MRKTMPKTRESETDSVVSSYSTKVRNVCWTLNNYLEANVEFLVENLDEISSYSVFSKEVGESGTPHLQGYTEFENPRNTGKGWSNIQKLLGSDLGKNFHFEKRRGTAKQASDYCKYSDYNSETHSGTVLNEFVFECGEISKQGKRVDYEAALATLTSKSALEVLKEQPALLPMYNVMKSVKRDLITPERRDGVKVIVRWGDAGSGKTEHAYDTYPDLYCKPTGKWWGSYSGQSTILLDDFYGERSGITYDELLRVLDKYKYEIEVKGGYVPCCWTTVIITSNEPPSEWFGGLSPALARRINEVWKHTVGLPPVLLPHVTDTDEGWRPRRTA